MPDFTSFEAPIAKRIRGIQARDWLAALGMAASGRISGILDADRIVVSSATTGAWLLSVDWDEDCIVVTEPGDGRAYRFSGTQNAFLFLDAMVAVHLD